MYEILLGFSAAVSVLSNKCYCFFLQILPLLNHRLSSMKNLTEILFVQILMSLSLFHYVQLRLDLIIFFQSPLLHSSAGFWPAAWVAMDSSAPCFLLLMPSLCPVLLFPQFASSFLFLASASAKNTFSVGSLLIHYLLCICL